LSITWSSPSYGNGYHYGVSLDNGHVVSGEDKNDAYVTCVH